MKTLLAEPARTTTDHETLASLRRQNSNLTRENSSLRADVKTLRAENTALRQAIAHQQAVSVELLTACPISSAESSGEAAW